MKLFQLFRFSYFIYCNPVELKICMCQKHHTGSNHILINDSHLLKRIVYLLIHSRFAFHLHSQSSDKEVGPHRCHASPGTLVSGPHLNTNTHIHTNTNNLRRSRYAQVTRMSMFLACCRAFCKKPQLCTLSASIRCECQISKNSLRVNRKIPVLC